MIIAVIGGGGREHAIVKKISQSKKTTKIYCIPGNAGISDLAECVNIPATDLPKIVQWAKENRPDLVMVAPDDPLSMGLVDALESEGIRAFGPSAAAAKIESSKAFSKALMKRYNIPTAAFETFDDCSKALEYVKICPLPTVVKADGLALGKGVIICNTRDEATAAVNSIMIAGAFGSAGSKVVIEEFLKGFEVSVLAFCDGKTIVPMVSSQDHKRALDNDLGLNTGGMGAFSPSKKYTATHAEYAYKNIFVPTMQAMNAEGRKFKGVIYFGLMIDGNDVKVLEYNARFGDPETQVVLPRLESDLVDVMNAVIDEKLSECEIVWSERPCACVVIASGGYPESYEKGKVITISNIDPDVTIYHAGTSFNKNGELVTNGGRVLGVTAMGDTLECAITHAYSNVFRITFDKMHYRRDIGKR